MIAFRFSNERTKRFPGNCLDHVSGFPPFSSNDRSWRHIGHLKPVEKLCNSWERNGKSNKAMSWCIVCEEVYYETCENWHRSFKVSLQHSMIPIKDIKESNRQKLTTYRTFETCWCISLYRRRDICMNARFTERMKTRYIFRHFEHL
jgi:hypothetical protein